MYADEADQDGKREYLIYAGVFIPVTEAASLSRSIESIRFKSGFKTRDDLKFSSGTKPESITREQHTEAKSKILEAALTHKCVVCCYVTPHSIAKGSTHEDRLKFGINTLLQKFDEFLRSVRADGGIAFFVATRDFRQDRYLREVQTEGLKFSDQRKRLSKVLAIHQSMDGQSHFTSLADIIVGSLRFVFNEPDKDKVGVALMKQLSRILWAEVDKAGVRRLGEKGICIRPKKISVIGYSADIQSTIDRLNSYLSHQG